MGAHAMAFAATEEVQGERVKWIREDGHTHEWIFRPYSGDFELVVTDPDDMRVSTSRVSIEMTLMGLEDELRAAALREVERARMALSCDLAGAMGRIERGIDAGDPDEVWAGGDTYEKTLERFLELSYSLASCEEFVRRPALAVAS